MSTTKITDFEPGLQKLLETVFLSRFRIQGNPGIEGSNAINTIYGFYSGSSASNEFDEVRDRGELVVFLGKLDEIRKKTAIELSVQGFEDFDFGEIGGYYVGGHGTGDGLPTPKNLWKTFFHFLSRAFSPALVKKRIYIHAARPVEINSIKIMRVLVGLLNNSGYEGLQEVKVSGPGDPNRLDTIVAYLSDAAAVAKVVAQIRTIPAACFAPGLPKVVKEELPGVGVTDEPADVQLVGEVQLKKGPDGKFMNPDRQSFGMFLSKLIWWALADTNVRNTRMDEFLEHFSTALQVTRIDPKNPHLHAHRADLEHLQQAAFHALARRHRR